MFHLKNILEFIEQSPDGVILFSFGSVATISTLPKDIKEIFIEALGQLPQRILMKYEGELEDKPKNVMTVKWIPQRDVLRKYTSILITYYYLLENSIVT